MDSKKAKPRDTQEMDTTAASQSRGNPAKSRADTLSSGVCTLSLEEGPGRHQDYRLGHSYKATFEDSDEKEALPETAAPPPPPNARRMEVVVSLESFKELMESFGEQAVLCCKYPMYTKLPKLSGGHRDKHELSGINLPAGFEPIMSEKRSVLAEDTTDGTFWLFSRGKKQANMTHAIQSMCKGQSWKVIGNDTIVVEEQYLSGFRMVFFWWDHWAIRRFASWPLLQHSKCDASWARWGKEVVGAFSKISGEKGTMTIVYFSDILKGARKTTKFVDLGDVDVLDIKLRPFISQSHFGVIAETEASWESKCKVVWFSKRRMRWLRQTPQFSLDAFDESVKWCLDPTAKQVNLVINNNTEWIRIDLASGSLKRQSITGECSLSNGPQFWIGLNGALWTLIQWRPYGTLMETFTVTGVCTKKIFKGVWPIARTRCNSVVMRGKDSEMAVFSPELFNPNLLL